VEKYNSKGYFSAKSEFTNEEKKTLEQENSQSFEVGDGGLNLSNV
jgi:hypothetical protein